MKQKKYKNNIFLFHKNEKIIYKKVEQEYIFIDEIVYLKQFFIILKYLFDSKKIFIATHIHPIFYKILFIFISKKNCFFTNKNNKKIEKFLEKK
jgi:predicted AAA+ superfamily ATPase